MGADQHEVIFLTGEVYAAMIERALTQAPQEACGLFTGAPGTLYVDDYHPMANAAEPDKAWKRYKLDSQEQLAIEGAADTAGPESIAEWIETKETKASKAGLRYNAAEGSIIRNVGEKDISVVNENGAPSKITGQIGDKVISCLRQ